MKPQESYQAKLFALSERVYERLLALYPSEHRREFGAPMAQLFRDQCRDAWTASGSWGLAFLWLHVAVDLIKTATAEHLRDIKAGKSVIDKALSLFRDIPTEKSEILLTLRWLFSWRGVRTILLIVVPPVVSLFLVYSFENWRGSRAWKHYQQEARAKGIELDFFVLRSNVPVGDLSLSATPTLRAWFDDLNFKTINEAFLDGPFNRAHNLIADPRLGKRAEVNRHVLTDLVLWQRALEAATNTSPDKAAEYFSAPNSNSIDRATAAKQVLAYLEKFDPLFNEFRRIADQPRSRWPTVYSRPGRWMVFEMAMTFSQVARWIQLKGSADLATGEIDRAREDIRVLLALSNTLENEHFSLIDSAQRNLLQATLQLIWEGIRLNQWRAEDLRQFQESCGAYDFLETSAQCMDWERAAMLVHLDYFYARHYLLGSDEESLAYVLLSKYSPRGWYDLEKANLFRAFDALAAADWKRGFTPATCSDADHTDTPSKLRSIQRLWTHKLLTRKPPGSLFLPWLRRGAITAQTAVNQAILASALEQYRLAEGAYPERLDLLTQARLLMAVPPDLLNGEPMKYRRITADQYSLYSVGADGKDDGGEPGETLFDLGTGDWPW